MSAQNRTHRICGAIDELVVEGQEILSPLGPNIWHGQTVLYDEKATIRVAAFLARCDAVLDMIGGKATKWHSGLFPERPDVNTIRQIIGIMQGLRKTVERGLIDEADPTVAPDTPPESSTTAPSQATIINVMIACPGDVRDEREVIRVAIHAWNALHAEERHTVLLPKSWDTDATPAMEGRAQEIINRQILDKCHLLVGVFWTRLGSPTGQSPSGTVEEIQRHLTARKPTMLYFSNAPAPPNSIDHQQFEALTAFRRECEQQGLIHAYESIEKFRELFPKHLMRTVRTMQQQQGP